VNKQDHYIILPLLDGEMERGATTTVRYLDICPSEKQCIDGVLMPAADRMMKSCQAVTVARVRPHAPTKEISNECTGTLCGCQM
jgi:hypothetical protein